MTSIEAVIADITKLQVDAIVNAANQALAAGGGVCGAIFRAAGDGLAAACARVAPCPTGEARVTPGFSLPAKYVIHAVGPIWHGGTEGEADQLAQTYRALLRLADEHGCHSIAIPAISTGIYGYPLESATKIAVQVVREHVAGKTGLQRVIFACFSETVLSVYREQGVA